MSSLHQLPPSNLSSASAAAAAANHIMTTAVTSSYLAPLRPRMRMRMRLPLLPAAASLLLLAASGVHRAGAFTFNAVPETETLTAFSAYLTTNSVNLNDPSASAITSLEDALAYAVGGDTIHLANGSYLQRIESTVSGQEGNPITIVGGRDAVIQSNSPLVEITHSWITLQGFSVDGRQRSADSRDSFVNKCIQVLGPGVNESGAIEGFVMEDMLVQNCGEECVRLKNFVVNSTIIDNTIQHCGVYDFEYPIATSGKTGEGVYIGTSWKQWEDYGEDRCNDNWVSGNTIATFGNECVEVKEGSSGNVIENNVCSNQLDLESGCFCSRGDNNTFRFNNMSDCEGSGIRLGGWQGYGHDNDVYDNIVVNAMNGAIGVHVMPQRVICHNECEEGLCGITGGENFEAVQATWDQACDTTIYSDEHPLPQAAAVLGSDNDTAVELVDNDDSATPVEAVGAGAGASVVAGVDGDEEAEEDGDEDSRGGSGDDDDDDYDSGNDDDDSGDDDDDSGDDDDDSRDDDDDSGDDDDDSGDDDDDSGDDDDDSKDDDDSEDDDDDSEDDDDYSGDDDDDSGDDDDDSGDDDDDSEDD